MVVVIPPRRNWREQLDYDRYLYRLRHLVENAFLKLKRWRGIATKGRYCEHDSVSSNPSRPAMVDLPRRAIYYGMSQQTAEFFR